MHRGNARESFHLNDASILLPQLPG
jgi:hypothetical protein